MRTIITDIDLTIMDAAKRRRQSFLDVGISLKPEEHACVYNLNPFFSSSKQRDDFFSIFLSDRYLHMDEPYEGAAACMRWLAEKFRIIYLTARHDAPGDSMRKGTLDSLERHGFPQPDGEHIFMIMRENHDKNHYSGAGEFKIKTMPAVLELGTPVAGLGDIPADAQIYQKFGIRPVIFKNPAFSEKDYPQGSTICYDWREIRRLFS
ncbi:hypothetical protein HY546_03470 [archaeon]|nr:hypothetical protein [archaeon]